MRVRKATFEVGSRQGGYEKPQEAVPLGALLFGQSPRHRSSILVPWLLGFLQRRVGQR